MDGYETLRDMSAEELEHHYRHSLVRHVGPHSNLRKAIEEPGPLHPMDGQDKGFIRPRQIAYRAWQAKLGKLVSDDGPLVEYP